MSEERNILHELKESIAIHEQLLEIEKKHFEEVKKLKMKYLSVVDKNSEALRRFEKAMEKMVNISRIQKGLITIEKNHIELERVRNELFSYFIEMSSKDLIDDKDLEYGWNYLIQEKMDLVYEEISR